MPNPILSRFLIAARNNASKEIYITNAANDRVETRGRFKSWLVRIFQRVDIRTQRAATANEFISALETEFRIRLQNIRGKKDGATLQAEYLDKFAFTAILRLQKLLANQLAGQRALTAYQVTFANNYVNFVLGRAATHVKLKAAELNLENSISFLESKVESFYGYNTFKEFLAAEAAEKNGASQTDSTNRFELSEGSEDVFHTPRLSPVESLFSAPSEAANASASNSAIRQTSPPENQPALVSYLQQYMQGFTPNLPDDEKRDLLRNLRSDVHKIKQITSDAIPRFILLSSGAGEENALLGPNFTPLKRMSGLQTLSSGPMRQRLIL